MDWSDEVRARLVREEERLRYKAANLQARGKTVMAAQELVVADDIRAALAEIELRRGLLTRAAEVIWQYDHERGDGQVSMLGQDIVAALRGGGK